MSLDDRFWPSKLIRLKVRNGSTVPVGVCRKLPQTVDAIIQAWQTALNASQAASRPQQPHVIAARELQVPATAVIRLPNATGPNQSVPPLGAGQRKTASCWRVGNRHIRVRVWMDALAADV